MPSRSAPRTLFVSIVAVSLFAVTATAASAATLKISGTSLVFQAAPGESNDVTFTRGDHHTLKVTDHGAKLVATGSCSAKSKHSVSCPARGLKLIVAKTEDLDDTIVNDTSIRSRLDGGADEDTVVGGSKADKIYGGDGEDKLRGRGGRDIIETGGFWADKVRCGGGRDTVFGDFLDTIARNCEKVTRTATP